MDHPKQTISGSLFHIVHFIQTQFSEQKQKFSEGCIHSIDSWIYSTLQNSIFYFFNEFSATSDKLNKKL